eukprot:7080501-Pyramimonas_sp.AAC.1
MIAEAGARGLEVVARKKGPASLLDSMEQIRHFQCGAVADEESGGGLARTPEKDGVLRVVA